MRLLVGRRRGRQVRPPFGEKSSRSRPAATIPDPSVSAIKRPAPRRSLSDTVENVSPPSIDLRMPRAPMTTKYVHSGRGSGDERQRRRHSCGGPGAATRVEERVHERPLPASAASAARRSVEGADRYLPAARLQGATQDFSGCPYFFRDVPNAS